MNAITKKAAWFVTALVLASGVPAGAAPRGARVVVVPRVHFYAGPRVHFGRGPFFYDPFWAPYTYPVYPYVAPPWADVRTQVTPKQTQVYVDGYFAGVADDYDGILQRLHVTPGGHSITLYLDGYRTITQNIYARPDSSIKLKDTMQKLPAGETSAPVPPPVNAPQQPEL